MEEGVLIPGSPPSWIGPSFAFRRMRRLDHKSRHNVQTLIAACLLSTRLLSSASLLASLLLLLLLLLFASVIRKFASDDKMQRGALAWQEPPIEPRGWVLVFENYICSPLACVIFPLRKSIGQRRGERLHLLLYKHRIDVFRSAIVQTTIDWPQTTDNLPQTIWLSHMNASVFMQVVCHLSSYCEMLWMRKKSILVFFSSSCFNH